MRRPRCAAAVLALLALAPAAAADPAGRTTLEETLRPAPGTGFTPLAGGPGEPYAVRRGGSAKAKRGRSVRRHSLAFFAQLTDPQIVDEMSPARVDFVDAAGGPLKSSHRPQEALGTQVFDAVVRNVNANRLSPVADGGGRRAKLGFALTTGDLADNQQLNETLWFRTVLDGGRLDPFSGKPVGTANPCGGATTETVARLDADVAARAYTGVQDYDDWRGARADLYAGYWDPDEAASAGGAYASFPRYPGLMNRAQAAFDAEGLVVPWLVSRGNHDGLIQGNAPASTDMFRTIAVGCLKVFPTPAVGPAQFVGRDESALYDGFKNPAFIGSLLAGARNVPPDPDRRIIDKAEFRALMAQGNDAAHGLAATPRAQLRKSRGTASYYAVAPRRGTRFIALDTVAEGGGQGGNLDHPQYRWLERQLRKARTRDELVVVFGHHTLATMTNTTADEAAGVCAPTDEPGCDADPRRSAPVHRGLAGRRTLRALLAANRHVISYVAGHTHANAVRFFKGRNGRGFWEINTASHIDWPQQSRLVEVMDNRDGTLSIFGTVLDSAAPPAAPAPGPAAGFDLDGLASLGRTLSFNDPQRLESEGGGEESDKRGGRRDRNVELLVRDPR
ncbi:MAG TPA: TIGR03767 family metallophosphoesterase [Solirubrobacteraceae bacterium]|nr:TIGR03767 family metallophosphoesterase [Solirubrobacteraceae bacterium]